MNARLTLSALVLAFFLTVGTASAAIRSRSTVMVVNTSQWAIQHIYMSSAGDRYWGRDVLGSDILFPGQQVRLSNIGCDFYDIQLVDEDGDTCVLQKINICNTNQRWVITNTTLLACESRTP